VEPALRVFSCGPWIDILGLYESGAMFIQFGLPNHLFSICCAALGLHRSLHQETEYMSDVVENLCSWVDLLHLVPATCSKNLHHHYHLQAWLLDKSATIEDGSFRGNMELLLADFRSCQQKIQQKVMQHPRMQSIKNSILS
jgi:hypothetical protein